MNLRLPVIAGVIAIAAGAAALRAVYRAPDPTPFTSEPAAPAMRRTHVRAVRESHDRIVIYVAGEVAHSGIYTLASTSRAIDALRAAGGPTANADLVAVNLAQTLSDGDEVAVPATGEMRASVAHRRTSHRAKRTHRKRGTKHRRHRRVVDGAAGDTGDPSDANEPVAIVDLNTAGESELETLPGVGETLAERIVAFREATGPYGSADDLLDVSGVTQAKLDAIAPYISAEAPEAVP